MERRGLLIQVRRTGSRQAARWIRARGRIVQTLTFVCFLKCTSIIIGERIKAQRIHKGKECKSWTRFTALSGKFKKKKKHEKKTNSDSLAFIVPHGNTKQYCYRLIRTPTIFEKMWCFHLLQMVRCDAPPKIGSTSLRLLRCWKPHIQHILLTVDDCVCVGTCLSVDPVCGAGTTDIS